MSYERRFRFVIIRSRPDDDELKIRVDSGVVMSNRHATWSSCGVLKLYPEEWEVLRNIVDVSSHVDITYD